MGGWKWTAPRGLFTWPQDKLYRIYEKVPGLMEQLIQEAVENARRFTATRPSAKSGKDGRVETGRMMDAIMGRILQEGKDRIIAELGFLDDQELYFALQSVTGFRHPGGAAIAPTLAIRDAELIFIDKFLAGLAKI